MPDPYLQKLRAYRHDLDPEKRAAFDEAMRSTSSPKEAWDKIEGQHDSGWKRAGGALAQLGRAPIKVAEGALDIGSRATGGPGSRVGLALAKARNRVQGVGDMLDAADPHGGVAGTAAEFAKIGGHAALAGLTGAGAGAVAGRVGAAVPGLAKAATALGEIGGTGWKARGAREGIRQALRTAPMTVALSGGDNGGLASSALGVKNKWGRAALDVAEDATFGSLTSALGARKAAKLAEQAKRAAETGGEAAAKGAAKKGGKKLAGAARKAQIVEREQMAEARAAEVARPKKAPRKAAPVGDTGDMPLVTPPKAKEMTRAEKKAANRAKLDQENAAREAARLKAKAEAEAAGTGKKGGKQRPADKFFDYMDDVDEGDAPVLPLGASDKQIASWLKAAKKADPGFDDFGGDVKAYKAWRDEWNAAVKKNASAKPKAPKAEPQAAPKAEAPKATTPDTPEVRAAKERLDAAEAERMAAKDDRLANGDNAARRARIRAAESEAKSAAWAHENAVKNAERKAAKAAAPKVEPKAAKAEAPKAAAEPVAEAPAKSEAGAWKSDPNDPRHGMSKAERKAYNQAEFAKQKAAAPTEKAPKGKRFRPGDVIGDGEAKLSPRTQAALDAEAETERLKETIGKPAPEPTKPNTANLSEKEKAELKRLKKVAPKAPKADKTLLSKMPDEELTALRSKLLREQETKMGAERPARGSWEAVDAEWQARKQRRAATKKSNAEAVDAERKAAKGTPEVERPPLAPKGKVIRKKSFNEGDGAQEASPVAKAVARGADEDEVTWRMRLHEQEAAKVQAAEAEVVRVRADRKATLAQTRAAQAALADARAAEKQAQLAAQRAARGWGEPRKGQPVQHSSLAVAEDRAKLAASKTELERLRDEMAEAGRAADAKPKDRALTEAAIASAKVYRAALAIAKREGMQAGTGAVVGGTLAAGEEASAQGEDVVGGSSAAARIGTGMLLGAGLAIGGKGAWRRLRGGTRNVTTAAGKVLREEERLALLPAEKRAAARAAAKAGNNPMAPVAQRQHMGPAYVDPNMPHPALGGKAPRDLFNFNREGFKDMSAESKARLSTLVMEQVAPHTKESHAEVKRAAAKFMQQMPRDVIVSMDPSKATRVQDNAIAAYIVELVGEIEADTKRLVHGGLGRKEQALLRDVIDRKDGELTRLARLSTKVGTEMGKDLSARRSIAFATSPHMFVARMEKLLGKELQPHEAQRMRDLINANDREGAVAYAMSLNTSGWKTKAAHLRSTGLLAGIPGRVKDAVSSLSHFGLEAAIQPVVAGIDKAVGRSVGRAMRDAGMEQRGALRSVTAPTKEQVVAGAKGVVEGAKGFVKKTLGLDVWRQAVPGTRFKKLVEDVNQTVLTADHLRGRDLPHEVNFDTPWVQTYVKAVQRVTQGVDNITKSGAMEYEKHNMARILAAQDVRDGTISAAEEAAKAAEYLRTPTGEMEEAMRQMAVSMTFQNDGGAAATARVLKRELPRAFAAIHPKLGEAVGAMVNMVVPFATTGSNIGARLMDYTPMGMLRGGYYLHLLKGDLAEGAQLTTALIRKRQRDAVEGLSRGLAGTGLLIGATSLGMKMYREGLITGQSAKNSGQRDGDEAAGRPPNSINFGGFWIPVNQYAPVGNLLTIGATIARGIDEGDIPEPKSAADLDRMVTLAWISMMTAARAVVEQPVVTGVNTALGVANDPVGKSNDYLGKMAGSFVPTFMNDLAYATDKGRKRMVDKRTLMSNVGENIAARIPGVRQMLPQDYDLLGGEVRPRRGGLAGAVLPISGMKDRANNPDLPEARAVWAAGGGLHVPKQEPNESMQDYSERTRIVGEEVRRAIRERMGTDEIAWPESVQEREALQAQLQQAASIGRNRARLRLREAGLLVPRK